MGNEKELMPFISSANIACGYHAGDAANIKEVINICLDYNVNVGAHPSFFDRENFGRTTMQLSPQEIHLSYRSTGNNKNNYIGVWSNIASCKTAWRFIQFGCKRYDYSSGNCKCGKRF